ncbi:putative porin, partial [Veillonella magna]
NEARANAEQQAMINRLADEFSSELNNLGVRVANLENRVGNIKVTGDARIRYQGSDEAGFFNKKGDNKDKSRFDFRGRVKFNGQVNENTEFMVRVASTDREFGNASAGSTASIDRAYVTHNFGDKVALTAGRYQGTVGNGLVYDDTFDGAQLTYTGNNFNAAVAYGYLMEGGLFDTPIDKVKGNYDVKINGNEDDNMSFTLLQANGKFGPHATLGAFYLFGNKNVKNVLGEDQDIYGASLDLNFGKVWVGGEYATFSDDFTGENGSDNDAWVAGIGYGDYNIAKQGTWGVKVKYFDEGVKSPVISSSPNYNQPYNADYKAWMATVDYALAKNVGLSAYATFGAEDQKGNDAPEYYRAELNYKF